MSRKNEKMELGHWLELKIKETHDRLDLGDKDRVPTIGEDQGYLQALLQVQQFLKDSINV